MAKIEKTTTISLTEKELENIIATWATHNYPDTLGTSKNSEITIFLNSCCNCGSDCDCHPNIDAVISFKIHHQEKS